MVTKPTTVEEYIAAVPVDLLVIAWGKGGKTLAADAEVER